jgi:hypothetical protein
VSFPLPFCKQNPKYGGKPMGKMIFEPLEIGCMTLKNRIGLAPLLNTPDALTTFTITAGTIK